MQSARENARSVLIAHGITLFGLRGVDGVGTREIAAAAGKPMSAITYHFGGKDELYLACAQHIAETIGAIMTSAVALDAPIEGAAAARERLALILHVLTSAMVRDETAQFARFVMREQQEPTPAFDVIYGGMMGRVAGHIADLLVIVAGQRLSQAEARVRTIALMGQPLAFRVARAAAMRLNAWQDIGPDEHRLIDAAVQANLTAILDSLEQEPT